MQKTISESDYELEVEEKQVHQVYLGDLGPNCISAWREQEDCRKVFMMIVDRAFVVRKGASFHGAIRTTRE